MDKPKDSTAAAHAQYLAGDMLDREGESWLVTDVYVGPTATRVYLYHPVLRVTDVMVRHHHAAGARRVA